jgi:AcrR family transcriptional regulator
LEADIAGCGRRRPGISVEGIARRLGTTKGSFYGHFTDRIALIAAVLDRWTV